MKTRRPGFNHILCPVDFSRHSRAALRHAASVARRSGGRLTVLFVTDPLLSAAAAAAAYDVKRLNADTRVELRQFVERTIGPGAPVSAMLVTLGDAGVEIKRVAKRLNADLIVLGTHGLSGAKKLFFGSTTEYVIRHAATPVLAVPRARPGPKHSPTGRAEAWPGTVVIVPTDLDGAAGARVKIAHGVASRFGAHVILVHVVQPTRMPAWLKMSRTSGDRERVKAARARLRRLAASAGRGVESRVLVGSPVEEIARVSRQARAGLIVLTLNRASALLAPRYGRISYRLVCVGTVPILAIPPAFRRRTKKGDGTPGIQ